MGWREGQIRVEKGQKRNRIMREELRTVKSEQKAETFCHRSRGSDKLAETALMSQCVSLLSAQRRAYCGANETGVKADT